MRIPTLTSYVRSPATQGSNVFFKLAGSVGPEAPKRGAQEKARPRIQSQRSRPRAGTRRVIGTDDAHLRVWGALGNILIWKAFVVVSSKQQAWNTVPTVPNLANSLNLEAREWATSKST